MKRLATVLNSLIDDPLDPNTNKIYLHPEYIKKDVYNKITIFENSHKENEKNLEAKNNEIETISLLLMNIFMWLSRAYGQRLVSFVCKELALEERSLINAKARKVAAYFAIFDLTDTLEHIDDLNSMAYVNDVADMIYRISDRYKAHALMVESNQYFITWKLDNFNANDNFNAKNINRNSKETASVSFTTLMKILSKLNQIKREYGYLGQKDFDHYVHISLHCGHFYEAVVGSDLKADISYIGLDICNAHKIHENLRKFKTAFCLSGEVFTILPECMKEHCRQIDQIKISVNSKTFPLYAVDVTNKFVDISDFEFLNREKEKRQSFRDEGETYSFKSGTTFSKNNGDNLGKQSNELKKFNSVHPVSSTTVKKYNTNNLSNFKSRTEKKTSNFNFRSEIQRIKNLRSRRLKQGIREIVTKRKIHVEMKAIILKELSKGAKNSLFLADLDIQKLFMTENEFKRSYRKGFDFYRLGAWTAAKEFFEIAMQAKLEEGYGEDGVCLYLLRYMEGFNFIKKIDWRGWRWLDEF